MTDEPPTAPPQCPRCREKGRVAIERCISKEMEVRIYICTVCDRIICKAE